MPIATLGDRAIIERARFGAGRKKSRPILQFDLEGKQLNEYPSIAAASKGSGVRREYISRCCRLTNDTKSSGGYIWKYGAVKNKDRK